VLLQAYIDESGTESTERQPFIAVAGFISTSENWANFSIDWQNELDKDPPLKYFKMREAFHRIKQFDGFSKNDAQYRVNNFIDIIKAYAMVRVSSSIDKREYDLFERGQIPAKIDSPYFYCFHQLYYSIIVYQRRYRWDTQIDFIFDEAGRIGVETVKWTAIIKKWASPSYHPYFGSPPIFRDDEKFLPLQAADLYAWLVRRDLYQNKILYMPVPNELKALQNMQSIERIVDVKKMQAFILKKLYPRTYPNNIVDIMT
jgi:hypothetical protein